MNSNAGGNWCTSCQTQSKKSRNTGTSSLSLCRRWLQRSKKQWPPMTHSFWMRLWKPVFVRQWGSIITCTREEMRQQRSEAFSSKRRTFMFCASRHSVISIAFFRQRLIMSSQLLLSNKENHFISVSQNSVLLSMRNSCLNLEYAVWISCRDRKLLDRSSVLTIS